MSWYERKLGTESELKITRFRTEDGVTVKDVNKGDSDTEVPS